MARFKIQAPDGRTVTLEGDSPPSEADLDGIFAQLPAREEGPGQLESAARGAAQGVTFGLSDEIVGGVEGAYGALTGDESFSDAYTRSRDESRAANEAAREENPWTYGASEIGSGALTGGWGAARAVGAKGASSLAARLGRGAAAGAGAGGTAGAGYSEAETPGGVLKDAATGAGVGGVAGAAAPAVGRVLQRAMNRFGGKGTAQRDVQRMFKGQEDNIEDAMKGNPDLMIGDLTQQSRRMLVDTADEDLLNTLTQRGAQTSQRVSDRAASLAGKSRMGLQDKAGTQIEHSYAKLPQPRTNMNRIRDDLIPQDDPAMKRIWANAERQAARRYGEGSKKYPMSVLHYTQRALNKSNDDSIRAVGRELGQELEGINPAFRGAQGAYREGSDVQRAFEELNKGLRSKSTKSYINKVLDESNVEGVDARAKIADMFGGPEALSKFLGSGTAEREMLQTLNAAQQEALNQAGPLLARKGKSLTDAVKALWIANAADSALGVQQKLGTATAARNLLYRVFELNPAGAISRGHRQKYNDEMRKLLTDRVLPEYQAAVARAITPREAAAGGGAAVLAQQE